MNANQRRSGSSTSHTTKTRTILLRFMTKGGCFRGSSSANLPLNPRQREGGNPLVHPGRHAVSFDGYDLCNGQNCDAYGDPGAKPGRCLCAVRISNGTCQPGPDRCFPGGIRPIAFHSPRLHRRVFHGSTNTGKGGTQRCGKSPAGARHRQRTADRKSACAGRDGGAAGGVGVTDPPILLEIANGSSPGIKTRTLTAGRGRGKTSIITAA